MQESRLLAVRSFGPAVAGLLLLSAQIAAAQAPMRSTAERPLYPPQTFAVAGARLGMTPAETAAALRASGYTREAQTLGKGWNARIAYLLLVNRSLHVPGSDQVVSTEDYRKGEERVRVEYIPTPQGARVSLVRYSIGFRAIDAGAFTGAVHGRYGRPTRPSDSQIMYCSAGEIACTPMDYPTATQEPNIVADVPGRAIILNMGARRWREYEASLKAEMDRRAPPVKRPTF